MDLNQIIYFVEVVRSGSFSKASQVLGIPKSTLSRKVLDLEERLGMELMRRTTRRQTLTNSGEEYYRHCLKILADLQELEKSISTSRSENEGVIKLTAPADADSVLAPLIQKFSTIYPQVSFDILLTDRRVDLVGEGVDLALRFGPLKNSALVAKKIGVGGMRLFASKEYLKLKGQPRMPSDLKKHDCIVFSQSKGEVSWALSDGRSHHKIKMNGRLRSSSFMMCRRLVELGMGIGALPDFTFRDSEGTRNLVPVLTNYHFEQRPLFLVYLKQKHMEPSLRMFIDFMFSEFPHR